MIEDGNQNCVESVLMKLHLPYVELMLWFPGFRVQNSKDVPKS
jgi:hypothetical protein